jgi:hypothetical protein
VAQIKVEILLPLYYNDNRDVEDKKFEKTHDYIKKQFGGLTIGDRPLLGYWIDPNIGINYENEKNTLYWVLCEKTKNNIQFFKN